MGCHLMTSKDHLHQETKIVLSKMLHVQYALKGHQQSHPEISDQGWKVRIIYEKYCKVKLVTSLSVIKRFRDYSTTASHLTEEISCYAPLLLRAPEISTATTRFTNLFPTFVLIAEIPHGTPIITCFPSQPTQQISQYQTCASILGKLPTSLI